MPTARKITDALPDDFIFGVATAAYQIEGAVHADGRGASIWDTFSHEPNRVKNGDTGDDACQHYHRLDDDLDMIAALGVDAYRFSIAWPRLFPEGAGQLNKSGLDFYERLVDGCKARNLKTFVTLYHWDLPQILQDDGGWTQRRVAEKFADYAHTVVQHLGDRIDSITTFNEPWCSAVLGNLLGVHAPGIKDLDTALSVVHGQHRAHGLAVQAMRAARSNLPTGIVLNLQGIRPASQNPDDIAAAKRHAVFHNEMFLEPLFNGRYPEELINELGDRLPADWQKDMHDIHQPLDFWGLNFYTPEYVTSSLSKDNVYPATQASPRRDVPRTDIGWEVDATALSELLIQLSQNYQLPECYITENGAAYNDDVVNGSVDDQRRIDYLFEHLKAVGHAVSHGVDVKGYFGWSLMDNFEWAEGYAMRFGLIHVDYQNQKRTLKNSALWFREMLSQR